MSTEEIQKLAEKYKADDMAKGGGLYYNSGRVPAFIAGFLAGQQSQWRKYPEEKPPLGEKVLLFDKVSRSKVIGWLEDYQDDDGEHHCHFVDSEGDIVFQGNNDMPSHWMPINLPTSKEGA